MEPRIMPAGEDRGAVAGEDPQAAHQEEPGAVVGCHPVGPLVEVPEEPCGELQEGLLEELQRVVGALPPPPSEEVAHPAPGELPLGHPGCSHPRPTDTSSSSTNNNNHQRRTLNTTTMDMGRARKQLDMNHMR